VIVQVDQTSQSIARLRRQPVASTISDFTDFLTHPVKISHISWANATTSALQTKNLVTTYMSSLPTSMAKKLANMYYFKAGIKITVVVQGAAQSYGQMVLAFTPQVSLPFEGTVTNTVALSQLANVRIVPHITVDPSKNNTYELELPVCTPTGFYQVLLDSSNHGSYLYEMQILNPLRTGTANVPTVNVCVYMSLVNPEFEALTVLTSNGYADEKVSDVVGSVSYLSALAAPFTGVFEPGIMLFSEVTGVASKVLRWFGFSKPPQADINAVALNRTCDNYSQTEGISTAIVLGCSQKQSLAIDPAFGAGFMEDMAISKMCSHMSPILLDYPVTTASSSEAFLFTVLVHPLVSYNVNSPSPTAALSMVSQFWCGDLKYTIEFIASPFTRATFLIAWDPFAINTTPPSFGDALSVLQNTTVQVVGNTVLELTVPYKHYMPVLSCGLNGIDAGPTPYSGTGIAGCNNGMLYFYVINPVVDNGSSAPTLPINIWQSSDNIAFFGSSNEGLVVLAPIITTTTLTSAGYNSDVEMAPAVSVSFGPRTNLSQLHQRVTGDPIKTVKDIVCRMDPFYRKHHTANPMDGFNYVINNVPMAPITPQSSSQLTRLSWIASAFLGYRGSFRYSFFGIEDFSTTVLANGATQNLVSHIINSKSAYPFVANDSTGSQVTAITPNYAWTHPNLNVSSRADVGCPIMIGADFLPTRTYPTTYGDNLVWYCDRSTVSNTNAQFESVLSQGAGDDGVFMWFLGFPKLG
jgi:hypothetical protein